MIFVVLGTQKFQLNRLLKQIDEYVAEGLINEKVVAQIGNSDYVPKSYTYYRFLDKNQFEAYIESASIIITHSGVGSIITALKTKKKIIVYPRLKKYNEHVDNHQLDIAKAFAKKGYVLCCNEDEDLLEVLEKSKTFSFEEYIPQTEYITKLINDFLDK
jgi:UDP-N-acetylglucosamine transferase subunit ALG13